MEGWSLSGALDCGVNGYFLTIKRRTDLNKADICLFIIPIHRQQLCLIECNWLWPVDRAELANSFHCPWSEYKFVPGLPCPLVTPLLLVNWWGWDFLFIPHHRLLAQTLSLSMAFPVFHDLPYHFHLDPAMTSKGFTSTSLCTSRSHQSLEGHFFFFLPECGCVFLARWPENCLTGCWGHNFSASTGNWGWLC